MINLKFEDAKGAIRSRASRKNRQYIQCPIKGGTNKQWSAKHYPGYMVLITLPFYSLFLEMSCLVLSSCLRCYMFYAIPKYNLLIKHVCILLLLLVSLKVFVEYSVLVEYLLTTLYSLFSITCYIITL
jgi:hypothetical protein